MHRPTTQVSSTLGLRNNESPSPQPSPGLLELLFPQPGINRVFQLPDGFVPRSFLFPQDERALFEYFHGQNGSTFGANQRKRKTMIVKPADGSQGDGIFLVQKFRDVEIKANANKTCIVQRYLKKPLLLGGLKFDLRIYVVLAGLGGGEGAERPMRIFLCKEGLARFCTEPYRNPEQGGSLTDAGCHLTNYSVQKRMKGFKREGGRGGEDGASGEGGTVQAEDGEGGTNPGAPESGLGGVEEDFQHDFRTTRAAASVVQSAGAEGQQRQEHAPGNTVDSTAMDAVSDAAAEDVPAAAENVHPAEKVLSSGRVDEDPPSSTALSGDDIVESFLKVRKWSDSDLMPLPGTHGISTDDTTPKESKVEPTCSDAAVAAHDDEQKQEWSQDHRRCDADDSDSDEEDMNDNDITEQDASKRSLSVALRQLREEYPTFHPKKHFWPQLATMVSQWVTTAMPVLTATYREFCIKQQGLYCRSGGEDQHSSLLTGGKRLRGGVEDCSCSQILGFDVMLEEPLPDRPDDFRLRLIEVNSSPSLSIDEVSVIRTFTFSCFFVKCANIISTTR